MQLLNIENAIKRSSDYRMDKIWRYKSPFVDSKTDAVALYIYDYVNRIDEEFIDKVNREVPHAYISLQQAIAYIIWITAVWDLDCLHEIMGQDGRILKHVEERFKEIKY